MTKNSTGQQYSRTRRSHVREGRPAGPDLLREINATAVLNLIAIQQPISRAELAKASGLTRATVSSIVASLIADGWILEDSPRQTTALGGKPPVPVRLNPFRWGFIGLEVRAGNSILALCDFNAGIVAQKSVPTSDVADVFIAEVAKEISSLRAAHDRFVAIDRVGVSLPGLVNHLSGTFLSSVVIPWTDVPFAAKLEERTGMQVLIDNSARCASLAELWQSKIAGEQTGNLVYVNISAGLACGIVINGEIYGGANDAAGQFGHMSIDRDGPLCPCGQRGCWDLFVSDLATVARYGRLTGEAAPTMSDLVAAAGRGDRHAVEAINETARYLAIGLRSLVNGLDPDVVVIGGIIAGAWDILGPVLDKSLAENRLNPLARSVALRPAQFGGTASLRGAFTLVRSQILARGERGVTSLIPLVR